LPHDGQEDVGDLATLLDSLFKLLLGGKSVPGIYETLVKSHKFMSDKISGNDVDFTSIQSHIKQNHAEFL